MRIIYAALAGFVLDLLLGDPPWMPHPVVFMGKAIKFAEPRLRKTFNERLAGFFLAAGLPLFTFVLSYFAIWLFYRIHPAAGFLLSAVWSWQVLAMADLKKESTNVYRKLLSGTLEEAREAVARIVGRDTERLDREGVIKAAVETVAENFSDGVIAPMFYMLIGGAPLALGYKAVNTMDSMIGYKNEKYLNFGRAAAKLDDAVNYIPARLSALLLIIAAFLAGEDGSRAFYIWRRDRRNHASPNSAQTEAAMAGALGIQLGGPAWYFGEYHDKPFIGDRLRKAEASDIPRANRMLYIGGFLGMAVMCTVRWIFLS
ncbi:MAG: cobalamin biosynthesis protein CobD [Blautia sp.]|nr:cobalamin biosynthesis protein CobD [Blautia sp.]